MPCWYYDKKELLASPSHKDGVNEETEARYRREGARFIVDTGTKMGLYPSWHTVTRYIIIIIVMEQSSFIIDD